MNDVMTRRGFVAAGTGAAAAMAALAGPSVLGGTGQALAAGQAQAPNDAWCVPTLCDGCGNHCGIDAWVRGGKLWRFLGSGTHPHTLGAMCGRGQGYPSIVYSEDRVATPMKNDGKGNFTAVGWGDALADIAARIVEAPASRVAMFQDGRGNDSFYTKRFMQAIGSANYFDESALGDADIVAGLTAVLGAFPEPDIAGSKYIVLLDKSTNEGMRPSEGKELLHAKEAGAHIVSVDPRYSGVTQLADEWVCVRPGYELAFLLGVMGELVKEKLYDADFVSAWGNGFDEFAAAVGQYTPAWAETQCDVPQAKIIEVAHGLADAAPHCYVDLQWAGTVGCGYANSLETVRCIVLLNAMLGNFNQEGGMVFSAAPYLGDDIYPTDLFPELPAVDAEPLGAQKHPLGAGASCQEAMRAAGKGELDVALFVESDPAATWPDTAQTGADLDSIGFKVAIDCLLTDTAMKCDYVLPTLTYLERDGLVETAGAKLPMAVMRNAAIDPVLPEAKPLYQIIVELAQACGEGDAFGFSLDDVNKARCDAYGVSYDGLKTAGQADIPGAALSYGDGFWLGTASGKVDFASEAFASAGYSPVPKYQEPSTPPNEYAPRLITGTQIFQNRAFTTDADKLAEVARDTGADRAWINPSTAALFGVADGDTVEISAGGQSVKATARVTERIHPQAVYLPPHYGAASPHLSQVEGYGARQQALVPRAAEETTGAGMVCEVVVSIRKVGA